MPTPIHINITKGVETMSNIREIKTIVQGQSTSDGDGVMLTRIIGSASLDMLDPFIMLDAFGSDEPLDYIGGFPAHPHRGFETVSYMLAGKMRHQDSNGNSGVIEAGGVQWMTAGSGIIHSEMPEQEEGLLSGFQLWVNLPASEKMTQPKYQEYSVDNIIEEHFGTHSSLKIIAGKTKAGNKGVINNQFVDPIYWDVSLNKNDQFLETVALGHNAFIYVIDGSINIGSLNKPLSKTQLAVLEDGDEFLISATENARFLVVAGRPLNEPIARGGPFVMNTREQLQQAFTDYQSGNFA